MSTTVLKPIKEEERQPSPHSVEPGNNINRCTVATETENSGSFSVGSIPFEMLEYTRHNLKMEVEQLEYEFRQLKEALYKARCTQVDRKLEELRRSEASELDTINDLVDSLYNDRKQVAKHRRDLQLESANKEYDNAIQTAMNDSEESIRSTRERLRDRLNETVCNLQVEFMMARRSKRRSHAPSSTASRDEPLRQQNAGLGCQHHYRSSASKVQPSPSSSLISRVSPEVRTLFIPEIFEEEEERAKSNHRPRTATATASKKPKFEAECENGEEMEVKEDEEEDDSRMMSGENPSDSDYLPGPDLEPRRKPVTLPANTPCFIYNLAPEEIDEDLKQINEALKIDYEIHLTRGKVNRAQVAVSQREFIM
ncbi:unnamed protein product [Hymenolepis diminuta]|uniref:Uncharacterized protein n=1 Tax=Hymenolepis diminuta TaxID=6216 RepID=A0A564YXJ6_HYMDI|nr:unnamed protein product [Hymenolepis diminuta]